MSYWLVPEGIRDTASRIRQDLYRRGGNPELTKAAEMAAANHKFKNAHKNERCFILATGPSINQQDLSHLSGELCIGVGYFYLHEQINLIQPRYHVFAPNHHPFDFEMIDRDLRGAREYYSSETTLFYGYSPYEYSILKYLDKSPTTCELPLHLLDYSHCAEITEQNFASSHQWDITRSPFAIRTVIYCAIQVAAFMGCKEVYLLGCDHDYLSNLQRTENHFYAEQKVENYDVPHLAEFTTERWFHEYYCRWRDYRLMASYLNGIGVKIFNATEGGMLDVFPRVNLADIVG